MSSHALAGASDARTLLGFSFPVYPGYSDEKEVLSLQGTLGASVGAVLVRASPHRCSLGHQGPCWESSTLNTHLR